MKRLKSYMAGSIALVLSLSVGAFVLSPAAETEREKTTQQEGGTKKGPSLRVDDLPKPIPEVMDAIKRVGDEVGKGISKATSAGAEAVNKAVKGQKEKEK